MHSSIFFFFYFKPADIGIALSEEQAEIKTSVEPEIVPQFGAPLHVRVVPFTSVGLALYE